MAKAKESGVAVPSESAARPEEPRKVRVGLEMSADEVLLLDSEGAELSWDPGKFPEFGEEVLRKLSYENARRYFLAQGEAKARKKRQESEAEFGGAPNMWARDRLEFQTDKLRLRARRGWHQTWCRGDQFDDFKNGGYAQVRRVKEGTEEQPGEETGEVIKIKEGEDRWLIAVEIPQDIYDEHIEAMSYRSQVRYSHDAKQTFRDHIAGIHRDAGAKKEVLRVVEDDEAGEEVLSTGGKSYLADEKD